jgi:hypothetical protein
LQNWSSMKVDRFHHSEKTLSRTTYRKWWICFSEFGQKTIKHIDQTRQVTSNWIFLRLTVVGVWSWPNLKDVSKRGEQRNVHRPVSDLYRVPEVHEPIAGKSCQLNGRHLGILRYFLKGQEWIFHWPSQPETKVKPFSVFSKSSLLHSDITEYRVALLGHFCAFRWFIETRIGILKWRWNRRRSALNPLRTADFARQKSSILWFSSG